jgi:hypothetical protein
MSNKSVFWLIFFSLTLIEIGQLAISQENPSVINQYKFSQNEIVEYESKVISDYYFQQPASQACATGLTTELFASKVVQEFKLNAGETLIHRLWMPAYLQ